jgi:hypothetical protein
MSHCGIWTGTNIAPQLHAVMTKSRPNSYGALEYTGSHLIHVLGGPEGVERAVFLADALLCGARARGFKVSPARRERQKPCGQMRRAALTVN